MTARRRSLRAAGAATKARRRSPEQRARAHPPEEYPPTLLRRFGPSLAVAALAAVHGSEMARASMWLDVDVRLTPGGQLAVRRGHSTVSAPLVADHLDSPSSFRLQIVDLVRQLPRQRCRGTR